jgi:hypothetical protein
LIYQSSQQRSKDEAQDQNKKKMRAKQDQEECDSVMQNDSFGVDIDSFLDLVGFGKENENNTATTLNLSGRTDVYW